MCLELNSNNKNAFLYKTVINHEFLYIPLYVGIKTFLIEKGNKLIANYISHMYNFHKNNIGLSTKIANNKQAVTTYFYYQHEGKKLRKDYVNYCFDLGYHINKISKTDSTIYCSMDRINSQYFQNIALPVFFHEKEIQLGSTYDVVVETFTLLSPEKLFEKEFFDNLKTVLNVHEEEEFIKSYTELYNRLLKDLKEGK